MCKNYSLQDINYYLEIKKSKLISTKSIRPEVPNLLEIQYFSFFRFLKYGLQQELQRCHVWFQPVCFEYTYYPQNLRLEIPFYSYQEIIRFGGSYSSRIILPRSFYDYQNEKIYFKWIVLGSLPLLTRNGHFLVNGLIRVCILQIIRGAGIYINKKVDSGGNITFYLDIVPDRGAWVRLEKDSKGLVWICMRGEPPLPLWSILQTIGILSFSSYFCSFSLQKRKNWKEEKTIESILATKKSFSNLLFFDIRKKGKEAVNLKNLKPKVSKLFHRQKAKLIYIIRKFSRVWSYDLGKVGRRRLNQRFRQTLPLSFRCLVPTDFLCSLRELNAVREGKASVRNFDDVDSLRVRRVRAVGDFLQREVRQAGIRLERRVSQNFESISPDQRYSFIQSIASEPFDQIFHRFVTMYPLLQYADQLNPLSDMTQKRRLTGLGPGGLSLSNRKIDVRTIHPSHFGCLCPVETPEGQNAGIVNSPTLISRLSDDSRLQVLVTLRQSGWIQLDISKSFVTPKISLWISQKIGGWTIRFAYGLLNDALGKVKLREFLKFMDINNRQSSSISQDQIVLVCSGSEQILALGPNMIPFIEHDDGNRVLIGANIMRQALPVIKVSVPRVSSELYIYARNDRGQNLRSRWSGFVVYVSNHRILVQSQITKGSIVLHHTVIQEKRKKKRENEIFRFFFLKSQTYACCVEYRLGGLFRSNQSTWRYHKSYVKEGDWVSKGDLLADGRASVGGSLAVGQNLLICYIPWDGLNFEDAIVGSERLIKKETGTSIHIEEWESRSKQTPNGLEIFVPFSRELLCQIQGGKFELIRLKSYSKKKTSTDFRIRKNKKFQFFSKSRSYYCKKTNWNFFVSRLLFRCLNYQSNFIKFNKESYNFFSKSIHRRYTGYYSGKRNFSELSKSEQTNKWSFSFPGYESLDYRGLIKVGTWVESNQIIALRIRPIFSRVLTSYERLLFDVLDQKPSTIQNVSFCVPEGGKGRILNVEVFFLNSANRVEYYQEENVKKVLSSPFSSLPRRRSSTFIFHFWQNQYRQKVIRKKFPKINRVFFKNNLTQFGLSFLFKKIEIKSSYVSENVRPFKTSFKYFYCFNNDIGTINISKPNEVWSFNMYIYRVRFSVRIYRNLQRGDKLAGRHGNKGILSRLINLSEMPYLPNGLPFHLVLNPLGIPSRINVGQIYETLLGLAGFFIGEHYFRPSFDERNQARRSSLTFVFEKLRQASVLSRCKWLFNVRSPGKVPVIDGRTNEFIEEDVLVGESYILKLVHIVDEKIYSRSTGPYSLITQQPVRGRARNGGQRVGEIEIWALEGFGASYILQEILTVKSDDLIGRGSILLESLLYNRSLTITLPDAFRVLACELQSLCLDIILFPESPFLIMKIEQKIINFLFFMELTLEKIVSVGIHLGHATCYWHPKMAPYTYCVRGGIHLIDLVKTIEQIEKSQKFISRIRREGESILFVGTKIQASSSIKIRANASCSFFINKRWLGGMLTNMSTIQVSLFQLHRLERQQKNGEWDKLPKKKAIFLQKRIQRLNQYVGGLKGINKLPGVVIIVGQKKELTAVTECSKLKIPRICRVDTDCNPNLVSIRVPINDDSVLSIRLFLQVLLARIEEGQTSWRLKTKK